MSKQTAKPLLQQEWFVVGDPWGNGTYIVAGHPDPHRGVFVADCEDCAGIRDTDDSAQDLAEHICAVHNAALAKAEQSA